MDCTIGWIRTKNGYIIFKNRDTKKEFLTDNLFQKTEGLVKIGYKSERKGCWIGINRYGIGFTSAKGPYREVPAGYFSWKKFNEIGEKVLKRAKSLDEAIGLFIKNYKKQKIGDSANILLSDKNHAYLLEFWLENIKIKKYSRFIFKTNHFELMGRLNQNLKSLNSSTKRLKKFRELFRYHKPKRAEDLIPLLTHHSRNAEENICRHGRVMTVGSAIFEVKNNAIICYYSLNRSPCKGKYNKDICFSETLSTLS